MADLTEPIAEDYDSLLTAIYRLVYDDATEAEKPRRGYLAETIPPPLARVKTTEYQLDTIFTEGTQILDRPETGIYRGQEPVSMIRLVREGEPFKSMIHLVPYPSPEAAEDTSDPVVVAQICRLLVSDLVIHGTTDHSLLPVVNIDVSGRGLSAYPLLKDHVDPRRYYSVQTLEKYWGTINLNTYLHRHRMTESLCRSLIYQCLSYLRAVNDRYPGFRHGYLVPEAFDCYTRRQHGQGCPEIRVWNYYHSQIPGRLPNTAAPENIGAGGYSDLYQMLNYLWKSYQSEIKNSESLTRLFDELLPMQIRGPGEHLSAEDWESLGSDLQARLDLARLMDSPHFRADDRSRVVAYEASRPVLPTAEPPSAEELDNISRGNITQMAHGNRRSRASKSQAKDSSHYRQMLEEGEDAAPEYDTGRTYHSYRQLYSPSLERSQNRGAPVAGMARPVRDYEPEGNYGQPNALGRALGATPQEMSRYQQLSQEASSQMNRMAAPPQGMTGRPEEMGMNYDQVYQQGLQAYQQGLQQYGEANPEYANYAGQYQAPGMMPPEAYQPPAMMGGAGGRPFQSGPGAR